MGVDVGHGWSVIASVRDGNVLSFFLLAVDSSTSMSRCLRVYAGYEHSLMIWSTAIPGDTRCRREKAQVPISLAIVPCSLGVPGVDLW